MRSLFVGFRRIWDRRSAIWGLALVLLVVTAIGLAQLQTMRSATSTHTRASSTSQGDGLQGSLSAQLTPGASGTVGTSPPSGTTSATPTAHGQPSPIAVGSRGQTPSGQPSDGQGAGATPTPSDGSGGTSSGQPTPTSTETIPDPTATTPAFYDDDDVMGVTVTHSNPTGVLSPFSISIKNTGTSTWDSISLISYQLFCDSGCPSGTYANDVININNLVAPGQSIVFPIVWGPACNMCITKVWHTSWRMQRNDQTASVQGVQTWFGPEIPVKVTLSSETRSPFASQSAPTCGGVSGLTWDVANTSDNNTVSCAGGGVVMRTAGTTTPYAIPSVSISGFSPGASFTHVHVHFNSSGSNTFAGFTFPITSDGCGGEQFRINADGTMQEYNQAMYYGQTTCSRSSYSLGSEAASSDYDLEFEMVDSTMYFYVDGSLVIHGGYSFSGLPGLTVQSASGSSAYVTFSGLQVYGWNQTPWLDAQLG